MTTMPNTDDFDLDQHVRRLLAKQRMIAIIWFIEDVQSVRPDLSDEQAWEVLQQVEHIHDAECGISWTTLEAVAEDLFPEPTNALEKQHGN